MRVFLDDPHPACRQRSASMGQVMFTQVHYVGLAAQVDTSNGPQGPGIGAEDFVLHAGITRRRSDLIGSPGHAFIVSRSTAGFRP